MSSFQGQFWSQFRTITAPFFRSDMRFRAFAVLGSLIALVLAISGLNVLNSFVGRDFITAIEQRHARDCLQLAVVYIGVFGLITTVDVFKRFIEERSSLFWRQWLTEYLLKRYLQGQTYYHLKGRKDIDNPDQRLSEDVRLFCATSLSFFLIFLNSTITLLAFSGVLWGITPALVLAAVVYAALGSGITMLVGRRLVGLDVQQFKKEADLRYELIRAREHAEAIALLRGEERESSRLRDRLCAVVSNMRSIIGVSRNINFFTIGYNYLMQIIPILIAAPLYIYGSIEFGQVTQAREAFAQVLGAFSLIVLEFQRLSAYGAVVARLGTFWEGLEEPQREARGIETIEAPERIAYEDLTLVTPDAQRLLIRDLSLEVRRGERVLLIGPNGVGRTSLLRATAGLWTRGQGRIYRPPLDQIAFLPQHPYQGLGTLRDQLLYAVPQQTVSDEEIQAVLAALNFEEVVARVGGLAAERDWSNLLSLSEQQTLSIAGLLLARPRFAFLDEATSALDAAGNRHVYRLLAHTDITYLSVGNDLSLQEYHDEILELSTGGSWRVTRADQVRRQRSDWMVNESAFTPKG